MTIPSHGPITAGAAHLPGRERVLAFNQWTGDYSLWQFERDGVGKCDPLTWPPLSTGRWTALRYTEFTFAGFTQLISLDPRTGTLTLTECDEAAFLPRCRGEPLRCKPLFTHTLSGRGRGKGSHELTYLGSDLLLHYERATGRYELLTFTRCGGGASEADGGNATAMPVTGDGNATQPRCGIASSPVLRFAPRRRLPFLPRRRVRDELPSVAAGTRAADRPDASVAGELAYSLERVGGGPVDLSGSWSRIPAATASAAHGGLMLDYDKESGEYRLLDLLTPSGVRSGLTQSSSLARAGALLFKTVSSSAIPRRGRRLRRVHHLHSCLDASARMGGSCGWCQATACACVATRGVHAVARHARVLLPPAATALDQRRPRRGRFRSKCHRRRSHRLDCDDVESLDGGGATHRPPPPLLRSPNSRTRPAPRVPVAGGPRGGSGGARALRRRPSSTTTPTSGPTAVTTMSALTLRVGHRDGWRCLPPGSVRAPHTTARAVLTPRLTCLCRADRGQSDGGAIGDRGGQLHPRSCQ